jgi:hypothetical protein
MPISNRAFFYFATYFPLAMLIRQTHFPANGQQNGQQND